MDEFGVFNDTGQKLDDYNYNDLIDTKLYQNRAEANRYMIDWHTWWNLGAPKLFPEFRGPLMTRDHLVTYYEDQTHQTPVSPWGNDKPTLEDLLKRRPMDDHIKSVLKTKGFPSRISEMIIWYLRCLDYEKRSASYQVRGVMTYSVNYALTSAAHVSYKFDRECDCLSNLTILDPLGEIDCPPKLIMNDQSVEIFTPDVSDTSTGVTWKLSEFFGAPNPPLPLMSIMETDVQVFITRRSKIIQEAFNETSAISSKIKVMARGTILNQHRRLLHCENIIKGFGESHRWRISDGFFGRSYDVYTTDEEETDTDEEDGDAEVIT